MNADQLKAAAGILKLFTGMIPIPVIREATEEGIDLLVTGASAVGSPELTPDEFRAKLAEHLQSNWQRALDAKFATGG